MALERSHYCPACEAERTFYRSASMRLHLGRKVKWACPECDFGFVEVDGIDTSDLES